MKIDLSKEQGALVPLYFFRRPLVWTAEERSAAPDRRQTANADRRQTANADRRQTANADRRQTDALNSLMKSRAEALTMRMTAATMRQKGKMRNSK